MLPSNSMNYFLSATVFYFKFLAKDFVLRFMGAVFIKISNFKDCFFIKNSSRMIRSFSDFFWMSICAMSFPGCRSSLVCSISNIILRCSAKKMFRVYTFRVIAFVANKFFHWVDSIVDKIRNPVSKKEYAFLSFFIIEKIKSISIFPNRSTPLPTSIRGNINSFIEIILPFQIQGFIRDSFNHNLNINILLNNVKGSAMEPIP